MVKQACGTNLPSQREDPERDAAIKATIRPPLMAMTAMHLMTPEEGRDAVAFWVEVLRPYPPGQIKAAFMHFARTGGGKYPSPQAIVDTINKLNRRTLWNTEPK